MKLVNAGPERIQISVSHAEFELLFGYVEHAAEFDHQMVFNHPELLSGFRDARTELIAAWEQGAFDEL